MELSIQVLQSNGVLIAYDNWCYSQKNQGNNLDHVCSYYHERNSNANFETETFRDKSRLAKHEAAVVINTLRCRFSSQKHSSSSE